MPKLPSGKGQLNITGVRQSAIEKFRALCEAEGRKQGRQMELLLDYYFSNAGSRAPAMLSERGPTYGAPPGGDNTTDSEGGRDKAKRIPHEGGGRRKKN